MTINLTKPGPLAEFAHDLLEENDRRIKRALSEMTRKIEDAHSLIGETRGDVRGLVQAGSIDDDLDDELAEIKQRITALEGTARGLERRSGSDALAGIAERLDDHDERFIGLVQRVDDLAKPKPSPKPRAKPTGTAKANPENGKPAVKAAAKATATTKKAA